MIFFVSQYFLDPSQILSNVPLSFQTKFLSRSLSLKHNIFISQSLSLVHIIIDLRIYIYLPTLSVFSFTSIFSTFFIQELYCLPKYYFTLLF